MKRYARMYVVFAKQFLKTLMQSKVNFWLGFFAFFLTQAFGVAFIYLIFNQIPDLMGWTFYEIVFIYGFSQIPRGIDHILTDNIWHLAGDYIIDGSFDRYLLRPINPLFHMCAENIMSDGIGEFVVGIILVVYAGSNLSLEITPLWVLLFIVAVILGSVIYTSIKLLFASLAFWVKDSMIILNMAYNLSDFGKYPAGIYSQGVRVVISYLIPFAFTAYFPASYFLGRNDFLFSILPQTLIAVVFWFASYALFTKGTNIYESAGN